LSYSLEELRARVCDARRDKRSHALRAALSNEARINVIAEVKRASPSKGAIRANANAAQIAQDLQAGGACAISVLTEESQFSGSVDDLRAVRAAVEMPVLRKDFIFDEYQLYETAEAGVDAALLIVAALDDQTLTRLRLITEEELGLDALVEVHTKEELQRALACEARLIGVNNRDLRTFEVTLETSVELAKDFPRDVTAVSESGLRTGADLARLQALGYKGFLIGESLMRRESPGEALRELLAEARAAEAFS
jgi:indole-3-glycerol phosphate synthase